MLLPFLVVILGLLELEGQEVQEFLMREADPCHAIIQENIDFRAQL